MYRLTLFVFMICSINSYGQNQSKFLIDSLKKELTKKPKDSIKVKIFCDLCWYYRGVSPDSAFAYGNEALKLSLQTENKNGEAQAYNDLGILYYDGSKFKKAISLYRKAMIYREKIQDTMQMASVYNKLGIAYQRIFKMDSAIFFATKALKIYESKNHIPYAAIIKNNIANIYQDLKQYNKALQGHLEVAETYKSLNDLNGLTYSFTNIGNAYLYQKDTIKALEYYLKGIEMANANGYKAELATLYNNIGSIYKGQGKYKNAISAYIESLLIRDELKDNYGVASASINLGSLYVESGEIGKAETLLRNGLRLAKRSEAKELELTAYGSLLSYYALRKNADSIIHYQNLFNSVQDSIFNKRVTKEVAEIQEQYNTAEREKKLLSQRADLAEKELELNRKNTQIIGLILSAILLIILGYLLYNHQKLKNKQLLKESELKEAITKIETQNRLQQQRLQISRDLHDNIGSQLTFIISSIENLLFGFNIKNEKLNDKLKNISAFTKDTIYELRGTIWAMNKNDISMEDLRERILNFVENAKSHTQNINFVIHIAKDIPSDLKFNSVKGMNIFRIIQEVVNNSIKHANATKITMDIQLLNKDIKFNIKDNGSGFELKKQEAGNGIQNITKRANEIDGILSIESQIKNGTQVSLLVNV